MKTLLLIAAATLTAAAEPADYPRPGTLDPQEGVIHLFNGHDLNGWLQYPPVDGDVGADTWRVLGDGILYASGDPFGYLRTTQKFMNYRLTLEWRWPEEPSNSGVLLHIQDEDEVWPKSIEAQLRAGDAGDIVAFGGTTFNEHTDKSSIRVVKFEESSEHPPGQWNLMEITSAGDTIEIVVNGVLQNRATGTTVQRGFIGVQSEGLPIEFRNIRLEPLPPGVAGEADDEAEDDAGDATE